MARLNPDYATKKACKEAIDAGITIAVYECTPWGDRKVEDGAATIEAPHHYHKWYGGAKVQGGRLVSVK